MRQTHGFVAAWFLGTNLPPASARATHRKFLLTCVCALNPKYTANLEGVGRCAWVPEMGFKVCFVAYSTLRNTKLMFCGINCREYAKCSSDAAAFRCFCWTEFDF